MVEIKIAGSTMGTKETDPVRLLVGGFFIFLALGLAFTVLSPDGLGIQSGHRQANLPAPPPAPTQVRESLTVTEGPTFSSRLYVGSNGQIALTVQNDGIVSTKEVWLQFDEKLFDGLILLDTTPAFEKDQSNFGDRFLHYPGLAPGEAQHYQIRMVAKTAGEYPFKISVSDPGSSSSTMRTYSGRIVVLP
jgi:hypothetical protein